MRFLIRGLTVFMAAVLTAAPAVAATVSGVVSDVTGAALPESHVVLRGLATGQEVETDTGADGRFQIENLPVEELEFQVWHERAGYLDLPAWPKGRFTRTIRRGENEMGTINIIPSQFHPQD